MKKVLFTLSLIVAVFTLAAFNLASPGDRNLVLILSLCPQAVLIVLSWEIMQVTDSKWSVLFTIFWSGAFLFTANLALNWWLAIGLSTLVGHIAVCVTLKISAWQAKTREELWFMKKYTW